MDNPTRRRRLMDYLAYIGIGLGIGALVLWSADADVPRDTIEKWVPLAVVTSLVFGSVIANRRHLLHRGIFWGILLVFLVVHLVVLIVLLRSVDRWKAIWWVPVFPLEMGAIDMTLKLVGLDPFASERRRVDLGSDAGRDALRNDRVSGNLEVAQVLEDFLEGRGDPWAWDNFMSVARVADERLEQIQRRVTFLSEEFPPEKQGEFCSEQGRDVIRRYIEELRNR